MRAMLGKLGHAHIELANDGQQAVDAITRGDPFQLILMDLKMPLLDGYAATGQIRQWQAEHGRPQTVIVALTANAYEEDRDHCIDAGMDDFLAKPIDMKQLEATLLRWLPATSGEPTGPAARTVAACGNDLQVFDEVTLLVQLTGDRELAEIVVRSALSHIPTELDQLGEAAVAARWKDAERQTHTLKGLAGQLGGIRLSREMALANDRLRGGGQVDPAAVADLKLEYQRLADALNNWLQVS